MREISSLVHILAPLNALANAKSLSIFERNYKFPFYLMSCKPWFGKISVENESAHNLIQSRGAERGDRALTIVKYV